MICLVGWFCGEDAQEGSDRVLEWYLLFSSGSYRGTPLAVDKERLVIWCEEAALCSHSIPFLQKLFLFSFSFFGGGRLFLLFFDSVIVFDINLLIVRGALAFKFALF